MNINNSTVMASFLNGNPAAAAPGGLQSTLNGIPASPAGSIFQQMISRMLTSRNPAAEASDRGTGGGEQDISGETAELLSGLLAAGGNLAMARFTNEGNATEEPAAENGQWPEAAPEVTAPAVNGEAAELIQALAASVNGSPVSAPENISGEAAGKFPVNASVSAAVSLGAGDMDTLDTEAQNTLKNIAEPDGQIDSPDAAALNNGKMARKGSEPVFTGSGAALQISETIGTVHADTGIIDGSRTTEVSGKIGSVETVNKGQTEARAEKQEAAFGSGAGILESGSGRKNTEAGSQVSQVMLKEISDTAAEQKLKTETSGKNPDGIDYRSLAQSGAVGEGAAQELNTPIQPAGKAEPYSQVSEEIIAKLEQKGPSEFKMQLEPEDLGPIDIKLKLSEGKLIIDILAANSKTHALLAGQVDKLIASMGLQNVQVESVQVSQQMNSQSQDAQSQSSLMNAAMDFSQRRQQEQFRGDFNKGADPNGALSLQQNEIQDGGRADRAGLFRYESHRMNYTV